MTRTVPLTWKNVASSDSTYINGTNFQYLRTALGCLKLLQVLFGAACVGIILASNIEPEGKLFLDLGRIFYRKFAEQFFLIVAAISLVISFCLLTACVLSLSAASVISKTIYEVILYSVACVLYMVAVVIYFVIVRDEGENYPKSHAAYLRTAVLGTINAILYLISVILASRHLSRSRRSV